MGIQDRQYYSEENTWRSSPIWDQRMMVTNIVIINVVLYLANFIFTQRTNAITEFFSLHGSDWNQPWFYWRTLTYGFMHSPLTIWHIVFNMFALWMLGRAVELKYGRWEFLRFYLLSIMFGGFGWMIRNGLNGADGATLLGASGGCVAVVMLFVFNYPNEKLFLYGVIPIPAWLIGVFVVGSNIIGGNDTIGKGGAVAYDVHLAGALFAAGYFFFHWNFSSLGNVASSLSLSWRQMTGPKLKVHRGDDRDIKQDMEADRILKKIHESGQDSLTAKERAFMQKYSKKVRSRL